MGSIAKDEREERMVWETQRVPTNSMPHGRPVFGGDFACPQTVPTDAFCRLRRREVKSKRKRRDLSSPGILAEGSNRQQSTSGGSKSASIKTGTLSRKAPVCGQPMRRINTHTHTLLQRGTLLHLPSPLLLSALNIRTGTEVTTPLLSTEVSTGRVQQAGEVISEN